MIKYGFLIKNGEIYDTKIQSYGLFTKKIDKNIIYSVKPTTYKRLYLFEPLLLKYDVEKVFELLKFNSTLKYNRKKENSFREETLRYASNIAVVCNYPPTYLTNKKYNLYRICQNLKKRLD